MLISLFPTTPAVLVAPAFKYPLFGAFVALTMVDVGVDVVVVLRLRKPLAAMDVVDGSIEEVDRLIGIGVVGDWMLRKPDCGTLEDCDESMVVVLGASSGAEFVLRNPWYGTPVDWEWTGERNWMSCQLSVGRLDCPKMELGRNAR
jgi:hypothetical protein